MIVPKNWIKVQNVIMSDLIYTITALFAETFLVKEYSSIVEPNTSGATILVIVLKIFFIDI